MGRQGGIKLVTFYVNIEKGLFYRATSPGKDKLCFLNGRRVEVEVCEMNTLKIDEKWYQIVDHVGDLVQVEYIVESEVQ